MRNRGATVLFVAFALLTVTAVPAAGAHVEAWELQNADWDPQAPGTGPGDSALSINTTGSWEDQGLVEGPYGSISLDLSPGTQVADLHTLEADYYAASVEEKEGLGACAGGSPRVNLNLDLDGDGSTDKFVFAHFEGGDIKDCPSQTWVQHDFYDPPGKSWFTQRLGCTGPHGVAYMDTPNAVDCIQNKHPDHEVLSVSLVWSSFWYFGAAQTYYDDVQVQDHELGEPVGTEPWCPITPDGSVNTCQPTQSSAILSGP
jgi:hypothetical protein